MLVLILANGSANNRCGILLLPFEVIKLDKSLDLSADSFHLICQIQRFGVFTDTKRTLRKEVSHNGF